MFRRSLLLLPFAVSFAAAAPPGIPSTGQLLVSTTKSSDPDLSRTVILLIHSDEQGVVGLIVNRRTDVPLSRVFPGIKKPTGSQAVWFGGPVAMGARALIRSKLEPGGARKLFADVWVIVDSAPVARAAAGASPDVFRVYAGYTGWSPGQLRSELRLGLWKIVPGDARVVFASHPEMLWPLLSH